MKHLTCSDCNGFQKSHYIKHVNSDKEWKGICLYHGYHISEHDPICVDFER